MSVPRKSMLLGLICLVLNNIDAEERIAYKKQWDFPPGSSAYVNHKFYRLSDEYHNLTYLLCDDYDEPSRENICTGRNCTVVLDTQPERSCPEIFRTVNNGRMDDFYVRIFPFGWTRAVIVWDDCRKPGSIKCTIVDFTTCESKDVVLMENASSGYSDVIESTYFIAYEDSFELVMLSDSDSKERSKYHVGAEGNVIARYVPWNISTEHLPMSSDDGFRAVFVDSKPKAYLYGWDVSLIKLDGSVTRLAESIPAQKLVSTAHETIGIAIVVHSRVDVTLFDLEGKLKLNTSVSYDIEAIYVELRNLADGGFLLAVSGLRNFARPVRLPPLTYYFTRVDAEGRVVGSIVKEPKSRSCDAEEVPFNVVENGTGEYCLMIDLSIPYECKELRSARQLSTLMKCYREEDFSKNKTVV